MGAMPATVRRSRPWGAPTRSALPLPEILHEPNQCPHPFHRHGVVNRGADPAQHAMALARQQPGLLRLREERGGERIVMQEERHVHPRATARCDLVALKAAGRTDERRAGKAWGCKCKSRWAP